MNDPTYENRGYLLSDFRLFRLRDTDAIEVDYHYHEFHKVVFFRSGSVSYIIEGKHYRLEPGDIILVGRGCVHRVDAGAGAPYCRDVLYISTAFAKNTGASECDLEFCFSEASRRYSHVLRGEEAQREQINRLFSELYLAGDIDGFGQKLLAATLVVQLLIGLGRLYIGGDLQNVSSVFDEKVVDILKYLNDHLSEDISIDYLSDRFFMSKYHMMRKFRDETGYSIHRYLTNKRLLLARELLAGGASATEACYRCGFRDYSTFSRAYKKMFDAPPRGAREALK